jgi:hypothetical protein
MAAGADPVPHASTSADMPLVDQDARRIRPPQGVGISNREKFFRVEII